jgi:hypothetical protein
MDGVCSTHEMINRFKILVWKPESKRPLRRPRRRRKNNIRLDLTEIGWKGMDQMYLAQDRDHWQAVTNTVMNLRVPEKAGNFLTS